MQTLIRGGTLVSDAETREADVLVDQGKIAAVGKAISAEGVNVVDATGKLVMPGGIDPHTHFDLPMFGTVSSDDHYTGHKAAAFGGTTTVMDFVPFDAPTLEGSVEAWRRKAEKAAIDYSFHMNLTRLDEQVEMELPGLRRAGITTLKVFMAYNGRLRLQDGDIFRTLQLARDHGMLVMAHCENGDVIESLVAEARASGHNSPEWHARTRPAWGAIEATLRVAAMAEQAQAAVYVVHMNAGGEADMLQYARDHGINAMGETCPQYLFFTAEHLGRRDGSKWVCSPPMRGEEDNQRLWSALAAGTLQTIGTDHCPFFYDGTRAIDYEGESVKIAGKELGSDDFTKIPNGLPGVQDRLPILWTYGVRAGKLTPNQFVALTSTNAARIFGLYPRKGALLPQSDADIVIWNPERHVKYGIEMTKHRTDYSLYEGWELVGYPEKVFLRGNLIVDGEEWLGAEGQGEFLPRTEGQVL
jgi:dihydropyrimidinase